MQIQDAEFCQALGMDATGKCLKHPDRTVCASTGLAPCLICFQEMSLSAPSPPSPFHFTSISMSHTMEQIQRLCRNRQTWDDSRQTWEAAASAATSVHSTQQQQQQQQSNEETQDTLPQQSSSTHHVQENGHGHSTTTTTNSTTPMSNQSIDWDFFQQALTRANQIQQWALLERDQEINRLNQQLQQLNTLNQSQQAEISTLQAKVEKQEKTINQELRMIKTIAMKRADSRRNNSLKSTNSGSAAPSPRIQPKTLQSSFADNHNNNGSNNNNNDNSNHNSTTFAASTNNLSCSHLEAPPKLPDRKLSSDVMSGRRSDIHSATGSSTNSFAQMHLQQQLQQLQLQQQSQQQQQQQQQPHAPESSLYPTLPKTQMGSGNSHSFNEPPSLPIRQTSRPPIVRTHSGDDSIHSGKDLMPATKQHARMHTPGAPRQPFSNRQAHNPPTLPLRQGSSTNNNRDTAHSSTYSDLTDSLITCSVESLEGDDDGRTFYEAGEQETLSTFNTGNAKVVPPSQGDITYEPLAGETEPQPNNPNLRQLFQHQHVSQTTSSTTDHFRHSQFTLDTNTDEIIYKGGPKTPSTAIAEENIIQVQTNSKPWQQKFGVPSSPSPTAEPSKRAVSKEIAFVPLDSDIFPDSTNGEHYQQSPQSPPPPPPPPPPMEFGVEKSLHLRDIMRVDSLTPSHNNNNNNNSNSRSFHKELEDSGQNRSHGQEEIRFDASAAFQDDKLLLMSQRRTSLADARFDASQQLLLEASQALSNGALPTPSSVKLRKSLIKSIKRAGHSKQHQQQPQPPKIGEEVEEIVLSPKSRNNKNQRKQPATVPTTKTKEIEFQAPIKEDPKAKMTLLERHLEGNRLLSESMHNKTEEEILREKVYGNAAMATQEDEEDDEYDYFEPVPSDLPVSKGYLEYSRNINLSPVSALTTGSYLRDNGRQESDGNNDEIAPRKALHNADFAKRLPLEDGFDSDEDDTEVQQEEDSDDDPEEDAEEEQPPPPPPKLTSVSPTTAQKPKVSNSYPSPMPQGPAAMAYLHKPMAVSPAVSRPRAFSSRRRGSKIPTKHVENQTVQDKYGDGGLFTGSVSVEDKLPHGYGKMMYDNERQYEGDWKEGRWHGFGRWINPNGDCYEGNYVYDARHGRGTYTWKNGNIYEGDFFEDKRQGRGTFNFANGNIYEGDFVNGVFEGVGRYRFEGGVYEGEWMSGRYHGKGLLLFADGSSYKGEFLEGVAHGNGEETGADGLVRRGIWENGRPQQAVR